MNRFKIDFEGHNYPDAFKEELQKYVDTVCDGIEPKDEIDNEQSRLKEKYGLPHKLTNRGYKVLKKTMDKYWEGKRLDDQELTVAYILLPKIILYEKVQFRILDMVNELEQECILRWGSYTPPIRMNRALSKMTEPNPDFIDESLYIIDGITREHIAEVMGIENE